MKTQTNSKIRILQITSRADLSGGPVHLKSLLEELKDQVDFFVACPKNEALSKSLESLCAKSVFIPRRKFEIRTLVALFFFCRKNKIKIIHSHGRGAGVYSRLLKFFGFHIIHTFHGVHLEKHPIGRLKLLADILLRPLTDQFISVSHSEKIKAISARVASEKKICVVENGIKVAEIEPNAKLKPIIRIGSLTRNDFAKGFDLLMNAAEITTQPFSLTVKGVGFENQENTQIVSFLPPSSNTKEFLASLDLYVSFSRQEGLPLSVLEAMNEGIPCLLSDIDAHKSFIQNHCAIGFDAHDPSDFINNLMSINQNHTLQEDLVKKAFEYINKNHNIKNSAKQTYDIYLTHN